MFSVICLIITIINLVLAYFFAPLRKWNGAQLLKPSDKEYSLTPIYFWSGWAEKYFYMNFKLHNDCTFAGIENDTDMCDMLKKTFLANTLLNISLIIGFLLTSTTVWSLIWMMFGHFFRFTNVFLLLSGVLFLA